MTGRPGAAPLAAGGANEAVETVDMSQVAGERLTPLPDPDKKKKKEKTKGMTEVGPTDGAVSSADQALLELGTKRGIETLFRSNYRVNMDLTSLARRRRPTS